MTSEPVARRILGIDPGLRTTGFGVITMTGSRLAYVTCGCIRSGEGELPARLAVILADLGAVIAQHRPSEVAIEKVFVNVNPQSTLLLGQARGAAICAAVLAELPVVEYTALQVKQAVVGHGKAAKEQVADMVRRLLDLPGKPSPDAADALACAIAHAHGGQGFGGLTKAGHRVRRGRLRLMRSRPAAVLFDMDGLMLDTEPLAARAWGEAAAMLGVDFDMTLAQRMIGRNFADCSAMIRARYAAPYPVDALLGRWHAAYDAIVEREGLALKPGVFELLDWLEGRAIARAVATSTRRDRARSKLAQAALLPRFQEIVGGDEVAFGKPAPDIYIEAARRLGASPDACVVLEDSEPGVRSALAAGMLPIMVPDLIPPSAELVALDLIVLPSLHDVLAHLAALPT